MWSVSSFVLLSSYLFNSLIRALSSHLLSLHKLKEKKVEQRDIFLKFFQFKFYTTLKDFYIE